MVFICLAQGVCLLCYYMMSSWVCSVCVLWCALINTVPGGGGALKSLDSFVAKHESTELVRLQRKRGSLASIGANRGRSPSALVRRFQKTPPIAILTSDSTSTGESAPAFNVPTDLTSVGSIDMSSMSPATTAPPSPRSALSDQPEHP